MDRPRQGKGRKAHATKLTRVERSEAAKRGALTRLEAEDHAGLPRATHTGERNVGGYVIPLYNLKGGLRVISERGFFSIIGLKDHGWSGGHRIARILADSIIKSFFPQHVLVAIGTPIRFLSLTGTVTNGYDVEILKDFCIAFSKAKMPVR